MSNNVNKSVWMVGTGNISYDYIKVLKDLKCNVTAIGRSKSSCKYFEGVTDIYAHDGGLSSFLNKNPNVVDYAIVATNENQLCEVTSSLIEYGVKNILVEKPASLRSRDLRRMIDLKNSYNTNVVIGYNRRFYKSIQECKERLKKSKFPVSFSFDFTEWTHKINFKKYLKSELDRWFLCNSSHVADLVFYLFGNPSELNSLTTGKLEWHSPSIFCGSGKTENGNLFTYNSNWSSAGRWGIEIYFKDYKLILKPLEKLFIQKRGELEINEVHLKQDTDLNYKDGFYTQCQLFLKNEFEEFCSLEQQLENFKWYYKITNYMEN